MNTQTLNLKTKLPAFKLRGWLMEQLFYWSYPVYGALFKRRRPTWYWTVSSLNEFEDRTFGKAIAHFLSSNGFDLIPKFENHDALHVLFGYGTHIIDEVRMQFCLLGNGKRTLYLFGVIIIGWAAFPECWHLFIGAYKRGKSFRPVHHWKFEHLLNEPLSLLRARMNNIAPENAPLFI